MKLLKADSITARKIEELEDFLRENNIIIAGIEYISIHGREFIIKDVANPDGTNFHCLPRTFDTERLVIPE